MNCYKYKLIRFDKGKLDHSVDATYIIHLNNNGRLSNVLMQLNKYKPTKLCYILFNEGYKKCSKLNVNNVINDLADSYYDIFKHANVNNYKNILILEDDFIFSDDFADDNILHDLNTFINNHNNFIYILGCIPIFLIPNINNNHYRVLQFRGSHSCIYSKNARNTLLNIKDNTKYWDLYVSSFNFTKYNIYCYKQPLCYQTFPSTESRDTWSNKNILFNKIQLKIINILQLDKKVEPGYTICYNVSKIMFYLFIIFIIVIFNKIKNLINLHK